MNVFPCNKILGDMSARFFLNFSPHSNFCKTVVFTKVHPTVFTIFKTKTSSDEIKKSKMAVKRSKMADF